MLNTNVQCSILNVQFDSYLMQPIRTRQRKTTVGILIIFTLKPFAFYNT